MVSSDWRFFTSLRRTLTAVLIAGLLVAFGPADAYGQADPSPELESQHAAYFELGGNGLLYTLNYDYRHNADWGGRAGLMRAGGFGATLTVIPAMGNYLMELGSSSHNLELGAGLMYLGVSLDAGEEEAFGFSDNSVAGTGTVGYRYQPLDGGVVFRGGLTPYVGAGTGVWLGLSVGYAF